MHHLFTLFLFIFIFVTIKVILDVKEYFTQSPEYLNHKTSCFDCEKEMISRNGIDAAWQGQPTKCFDCERSGILQANGDVAGGFIAKTMKHY